MNKFIACVITITVLGTAVLGFRTMMHGSNHLPTDCVARVLGTRCGDGWSSLADVTSHVGMVKAFTLAVGVMVLIMAAAGFVVQRRLVDATVALSPPLPVHAYAFFSHPLLLRSRRWLALREKRDPSALHGVYEGSSRFYP